MIAMLHADTLLESNHPESQKIALEYGQVFLSRPQLFYNQSLISSNPKMFEQKTPKKVFKISNFRSEEKLIESSEKPRNL